MIYVINLFGQVKFINYFINYSMINNMFYNIRFHQTKIRTETITD